MSPEILLAVVLVAAHPAPECRVPSPVVAHELNAEQDLLLL